MNAIRVQGEKDNPTLVWGEAAEPVCGPDEVLVDEVVASDAPVDEIADETVTDEVVDEATDDDAATDASEEGDK